MDKFPPGDWWYLTNDAIEVVRQHGPTTFCVLAYLARRADSESRCYPSRQKIATDLKLSPRTVSRAVAALQASGIIAVEPPPPGHPRFKGEANSYRIVRYRYQVPPVARGALSPGAKNDTHQVPKTTSPGAKNDITRCQKRHHQVPKTTSPGAKNDIHQVTPVAPQEEIYKKKSKKKSKKKISAARFVRPTLEEVTAYCQERGNQVDPQKWIDYYTANGWKVGRNPMKDWKAAIRNWERNEKSTKVSPKPVPRVATKEDSLHWSPTHGYIGD